MNKPIILLDKPQMPENIGAVARAMANFSLSDLRIIQPREGELCDKAYAMASGADYILDNVRIYDHLSEALSDIQIVFATTARKRDMHKKVITPRETAQNVKNNFSHMKSGFLFGGERAGLDNAALKYADYLVTIPVNPEFSSLNLAQAVLLLSYEWFHIQDNSIEDFPLIEQATKKELHYFFDHLEITLQEKDFFYPEHKKDATLKTLYALFNRASLSPNEVRMLRGVLTCLGK